MLSKRVGGNRGNISRSYSVCAPQTIRRQRGQKLSSNHGPWADIDNGYNIYDAFKHNAIVERFHNASGGQNLNAYVVWGCG